MCLLPTCRLLYVCCRRQRVEQIVTAIGEVGGLEQYAYLFLLAYAFLLRLPSEALPVKVGPCEGRATLTLVGDKLVLKLARRYQPLHAYARSAMLSARRVRKNRPQGSVLERGCWCKESKVGGHEPHLVLPCCCILIAGHVPCSCAGPAPAEALTWRPPF